MIYCIFLTIELFIAVPYLCVCLFL